MARGDLDEARRTAKPDSPERRGSPLIDAHAHLNFPDYEEDLPAVIQRAREAGVEAVICVGTDLSSSRRAVELASSSGLGLGIWARKSIGTEGGESQNAREKGSESPSTREKDVDSQSRGEEGSISQGTGASQRSPGLEIYAAVGFHPLESREVDEEKMEPLSALAGHPRVVAIGETGLDFYREKPPLPHQERAFRHQIRIARKRGLPLIIHARDSLREVREILEEEGLPPAGGVMHCFGGSGEEALEFVRLGFYIGLGGPVTFKNAARAREVAVVVPLERLLLETDCPFLSPHPFRGQRNEPARLSLIAREIALLRGLSVEEVDRVTSANARRLFRLPEPGQREKAPPPQR